MVDATFEDDDADVAPGPSSSPELIEPSEGEQFQLACPGCASMLLVTLHGPRGASAWVPTRLQLKAFICVCVVLTSLLLRNQNVFAFSPRAGVRARHPPGRAVPEPPGAR